MPEKMQLEQAIDEWRDSHKFLRVLETAGDFSPCAHFVKEWEGPEQPFRMLWISRRYEEIWKKSASEYQGKTDFDVWSKECAEQFMIHDHECFRLRKAIWSIEDADGIPCAVCKYPVDTPGFRGIAGLAIPVNEIRPVLP